VLLAPRVDEALRDLRVRYFRNLARRMPAHVTLLFPFRSPIDDLTLATVGTVCAGLRAFAATFRESGRFRSDVVWLRPEPDDDFEHASDAVLSTFADCAPYGDAYAGRTLHLTVASRLRGREADQLLDEIGDVLPLTDRIDRVSLMAETGSGWRETHSWRLLAP
jgi:2'-5' RNA ligase